MEAAKFGLPGCVRALAARGAELDVQSKELFTALHYAAYAGRLEALRYAW